MNQILVPTSGTTAAYESADYVMQIAQAIGAEVHILHVVSTDDDGEADEPLKMFEMASEFNQVKVRGVIRYGNVVKEIIDYAENNHINLVLMGASNGEVVEKWLGHDVLGHTSIPVLVMPYQIFAGVQNRGGNE